MESLLRSIGPDWDVPDFSTLRRRRKTRAVNIPHRGAQGPLHLLIDSTGIKVEGEGAGNARKHGGPKRRVWRRIRIGIARDTSDVRAVEVVGSEIGDAPVLPALSARIPADQDMASVTADGACDTRKGHHAVAEPGADAVMPPRKNAKPWTAITAGAITAGAVARNEALRASKYRDRALWRRRSGYHRRSRVETEITV
jgi:hypothetical protein